MPLARQGFGIGIGIQELSLPPSPPPEECASFLPLLVVDASLANPEMPTLSDGFGVPFIFDPGCTPVVTRIRLSNVSRSELNLCHFRRGTSFWGANAGFRPEAGYQRLHPPARPTPASVIPDRMAVSQPSSYQRQRAARGFPRCFPIDKRNPAHPARRPAADLPGRVCHCSCFACLLQHSTHQVTWRCALSCDRPTEIGAVA